MDRSTMRYASKRASDAPERALLKELAAERRRFGYRRLREMARRRGVVMCQRASESPQFGARKIPTLAGVVISR